MWLDSHCHITANRFDEDREEVIARAREAGVDTFIPYDGQAVAVDDEVTAHRLYGDECILRELL